MRQSGRRASYTEIQTPPALPLVLTGGGPLDATDLASLRLYREAFADYRIATASALAILLFLVNLILTVAYLKTAKART